jgi:lambda repressor-like predicted transcriptional regulator
MKAQYPQLVTPTKNKGITLKIENDGTVGQKTYSNGTYRSWKQYERIIKNDTEPTNNSRPAEILNGSTQD